MFYVYVYLREDNTPYYIGKGKNNRAYVPHLREIKPNVRIDLKPKDSTRIKILEYFEQELDALAYESSLIKNTPNIVNLMEGGKQPPSQKGVKRSLETKRLQSSIAKKRFSTTPGTMLGKKLIESQVAKISYKVETPLGIFISSVRAAEAHKVNQQTIINRCKSTSNKFSDYRILETGQKYD